MAAECPSSTDVPLILSENIGILHANIHRDYKIMLWWNRCSCSPDLCKPLASISLTTHVGVGEGDKDKPVGLFGHRALHPGALFSSYRRGVHACTRSSSPTGLFVVSIANMQQQGGSRRGGAQGRGNRSRGNRPRQTHTAAVAEPLAVAPVAFPLVCPRRRTMLWMKVTCMLRTFFFTAF